MNSKGWASKNGFLTHVNHWWVQPRSPFQSMWRQLSGSLGPKTDYWSCTGIMVHGEYTSGNSTFAYIPCGSCSIWDVQTHMPEQSLRFEAPLYVGTCYHSYKFDSLIYILQRLGGTLCPKIQKFAARTIYGEMQIYGFPLNAEQVWLPKEPRLIYSLHPIHAGTGIIVGTRGRAIIVDIQKTLLVQILSHDDSDTTEIRSLAVRVFMHKFSAHYLLNFSATMTRMTNIAWLPLHQIKASSSGNHRESGASAPCSIPIQS